MRELKTYKWIVLLFCYYIYPFVVHGASVFSYAMTYGIPLIYVILNYRLLIKLVRKVKKSQFQCLVLIIILVLLSIIYPILHQTDDYSYVMITTFVFRKLFVYIFLCLILIKRYKEKASPEIFMYYFCIATSLYVICTIAFVGVPPLKEFWVSKVNSEDMIERFHDTYGYVARTGWQGFSGFRNTLRCSIAIVFLIYLLYEKEQIKKFVFAVLFLLCGLGNLFYGRVGVAVSAICIIMAVFRYKIVKPTVVLKWCLAAGGLLIAVYILCMINPLMNQWYVWVTRPFINLLTTGSFNNASVNELVEKIFLPETKTLIWGDGRYTFEGHYYMRTDSGFMRKILFWGVPCTLLAYYVTWLSMKSFQSKKIFLLLLVSFMIFEVKAEVYSEFISWMLSLSFLDNWEKRVNEPKRNLFDG